MLKTRAGQIVGNVPGLAPLSVTVPGACAMTGLGKTKVNELIATGELRSFKVGSRRLIPVAGIHELIARREAA